MFGQPSVEGMHMHPTQVVKIIVALIVGVFALMSPLTVITAAIIYTLLKDHLTKPMWAVLLGGSALSTAFSPLRPLMDSASVWVNVARASSGAKDWGDVVQLPGIIIMGALIASFLGTFWADDGWEAVKSLFVINNDPLKLKKEIIVPEDHSKIRAKIIKAPGLEPYVIGNPLFKKKTPPDGKGAFPMGRGKKKDIVYLTEKALKTHAFIIGSTGSGKTETIKWLAGAALDRGWGVYIIDLKEDTEPGGLRDFCRGYSYCYGTDYQEIALGDMGGKWWFNALGGMTADDAFNSVMALVDFDDEYHQNMNRKACQPTLQLMYEAYEIDPVKFKEPSLFALGKLLMNLNSPAMKQMAEVVAKEKGNEYVQELYGVVLKPDKDLITEAMSLGTKLTNMYDSRAGRNVLMPGSGDGERKQIDVLQDGLTYIGMSSLAQLDTARAVSSSVLQRFAVLASDVSRGVVKEKKDRLVIVDEASIINRELTLGLLNKARSAGVRMVLATQGPNDWIDKNGDDWDRLTQNTNCGLIMKQLSPESKEMAAEYLGKIEHGEVSHQVADGELTKGGNIKTAESYRVHPSMFGDFEEGEMVLKQGKEMKWIQCPLRLQELKEYKAAGSPPPPAPDPLSPSLDWDKVSDTA